MNRRITGFELDAESHWLAELACGHRQHVRHDPPLSERPWVLTAEGRQAHMGSNLDCLRCDRSELPEGYGPYRRTDVFSEASVPHALLANHTTKRGTWALIHVLKGQLEYQVQAPYDRQEILSPDVPGVVLPEVEHHVAISGPVEFFVEFWRSVP